MWKDSFLLVSFQNFVRNDHKEGDGILDQDSVVQILDQIVSVCRIFLFEVSLEMVAKASVLKTSLDGLNFILDPNVNVVQKLNSNDFCAKKYICHGKVKVKILALVSSLVLSFP